MVQGTLGEEADRWSKAGLNAPVQWKIPPGPGFCPFDLRTIRFTGGIPKVAVELARPKRSWKGIALLSKEWVKITHNNVWARQWMQGLTTWRGWGVCMDLRERMCDCGFAHATEVFSVLARCDVAEIAAQRLKLLQTTPTRWRMEDRWRSASKQEKRWFMRGLLSERWWDEWQHEVGETALLREWEVFTKRWWAALEHAWRTLKQFRPPGVSATPLRSTSGGQLQETTCPWIRWKREASASRSPERPRKRRP